MRNFFEWFFMATEMEVLRRFASLPGAVVSKKGEWVYIPGTRENRVLLVAHADTVFSRPPSEVLWNGNIAKAENVYGYYEKTKSGGQKWVSYKGGPVGLGADDRVGCAMMWTFRNAGHSILITTGEERGCVGARAAARELGKAELGNHQFAIEVDRRGDSELIFYNVGTDEFKKYMVEQSRKGKGQNALWRIGQGSFTDICVLCSEAEICGVNLAAGYLGEHRSEEMFIMDAWLRTRRLCWNILSQKELPKFPLVTTTTVRTYGPPARSGHYYGWEDEVYDEAFWERMEASYANRSSLPPIREHSDKCVCVTCLEKRSHKKAANGNGKPATTTDKEEAGADGGRRPIPFLVSPGTGTEGTESGIISNAGEILEASQDILIQDDVIRGLTDHSGGLSRSSNSVTMDVWNGIDHDIVTGKAWVVDDFLWEDARGYFTLSKGRRTYGELTMDEGGKLILINGEGHTIWMELSGPTPKTIGEIIDFARRRGIHVQIGQESR